MSGTKNAGTLAVEEKKENPTPTFLRDDYPYKAAGCEVTDIDTLNPDAVYEIKCPACEISIRAQGRKIHATYERINNLGCVSCGNKELSISVVDINPQQT